ncbi:hypothetical protein ACNHKD_00730 [Methylocystis sp. JAN1]|uniref:hypothetical protein n=1 Tax=Methylocystis sp. JAN1 TaxID=3397211 RepID=UPI003FA1F8C6
MNTANLQLEGLYVVVATILEAMCEKGIFQREEIEALLAKAESALSAETSRPPEMRDANVEAICFPVRLLRQALQISSDDGQGYSFADLASRVAQAKRKT